MMHTTIYIVNWHVNRQDTVFASLPEMSVYLEHCKEQILPSCGDLRWHSTHAVTSFLPRLILWCLLYYSDIFTSEQARTTWVYLCVCVCVLDPARHAIHGPRCSRTTQHKVTAREDGRESKTAGNCWRYTSSALYVLSVSMFCKCTSYSLHIWQK